jgi:sterol 3beta-glucosyltransferase
VQRNAHTALSDAHPDFRRAAPEGATLTGGGTMHIAIATVGTRGDAQPYVALGTELIRRGHRVTLVTHEDHRELAESNGLGFRSVCGSFKALLNSPEGVAWLESGANLRRYMQTFRAVFVPVADAWMDDFDGALTDCDGVLVHSFAMGAQVVATRRKLPMVVLSPFAAVPSKALTVVGLPLPLIGPWLDKKLFGWFLDQAWSIADASIERYLARFGQTRPPRSFRQVVLESGAGHLHLFSPTLLARPADWPACAEVTGFCFLDTHKDWRPGAQLEAFLNAGQAPIYVGFGSMTGMDPAALAEMTRKAIDQAGCRAIVAMGWGGMAGFQSSDRVMVVDEAPHDWLFPRMAAVVHHCGAGTTAAALRAGKASVAVPFFGDQPAWAALLVKFGVAPPAIAKQKLTAERLAQAIIAVTSTESFSAKARALGETIRAEQGLTLGADRVLQYLGAAR